MLTKGFGLLCSCILVQRPKKVKNWYALPTLLTIKTSELEDEKTSTFSFLTNFKYCWELNEDPPKLPPPKPGD